MSETARTVVTHATASFVRLSDPFISPKRKTPQRAPTIPGPEVITGKDTCRRAVALEGVCDCLLGRNNNKNKKWVRGYTESERLSLATNQQTSATAHTAPVRKAGKVTFGLITGSWCMEAPIQLRTERKPSERRQGKSGCR